MEKIAPEVEISIAHDGTKREVFDLTLYGISIRIHNVTGYYEQLHPRRRFIKKDHSEIYLRHLLLLKLDHHIRIGTTEIPELAWISNKNKIQNYYVRDCFNHFKKYCATPIEYLLGKESYFSYLMKDPWCFEQDNFQLSLEEFVDAYNKHHDGCVVASELKEASIEASWNIAFNSEPLDLSNTFITIKI